MKRKRIYLVIAILVLIISITAVSFALWNSQFTQSSANVINTGCLELKLTNDSNAISLSNQYPISDTAGKKFVGYTFTVSNTCTIAAAYNISLDFKTGSSYFTASQIKAYVSGDQTVEPKLLNNFNSSSVLSSGYNSSRLILSDEILPVASSENTTKSSKTYTLRVWIGENVTTSDGTNKTFDGKLTISAVSAKNNILAQRVLKDNVVHTETPVFAKGEPIASLGYQNTGSGLYQTNDDDGKSYYFRGNESSIQNNVTFAGRKWKIVRINGDNTIRMILVDTIGTSAFNAHTDANNEKYVGYTYDNASACTKSSPCISSFNSSSSTFSNNKTVTNSTIKSTLENWYKNNLASYDSKIALGSYCNDTTYGSDSGTILFGPHRRLSSAKPSLLCDDDGTNVLYGGYYKLKVGLMTVDEAIYAGLSEEVASDKTNYLYYKNSDYYSWYTMSPSNFNVYNSFMYVIDGMRFNVDMHIINNSSVTSFEFSTRPVINLNSNVDITGGDGTSTNPYTIG